MSFTPPVSPSGAVGDPVDPAVLNENFQALRDYMNAQIKGADLVAQSIARETLRTGQPDLLAFPLPSGIGAGHRFEQGDAMGGCQPRSSGSDGAVPTIISVQQRPRGPYSDAVLPVPATSRRIYMPVRGACLVRVCMTVQQFEGLLYTSAQGWDNSLTSGGTGVVRAYAYLEIDGVLDGVIADDTWLGSTNRIETADDRNALFMTLVDLDAGWHDIAVVVDPRRDLNQIFSVTMSVETLCL